MSVKERERERERERDLILKVMVLGEVGMIESLSCSRSLVRVHVQQLSQELHGRGVSSHEEREEISPRVVGQGGDVAPCRLVVNLLHQCLVGSAADLDDPCEMLAIFARS